MQSCTRRCELDSSSHALRARPVSRTARLQKHTVKPRLHASKSPLAALTDNIPDPIIRAAMKEPIAFWGGVFAAALQLKPSQDPLRSWVQRTGGTTPSQQDTPSMNDRNGQWPPQ